MPWRLQVPGACGLSGSSVWFLPSPRSPHPSRRCQASPPSLHLSPFLPFLSPLLRAPHWLRSPPLGLGLVAVPIPGPPRNLLPSLVDLHRVSELCGAAS